MTWIYYYKDTHVTILFLSTNLLLVFTQSIATQNCYQANLSGDSRIWKMLKSESSYTSHRVLCRAEVCCTYI